MSSPSVTLRIDDFEISTADPVVCRVVFGLIRRGGLSDEARACLMPPPVVGTRILS